MPRKTMESRRKRKIAIAVLLLLLMAFSTLFIGCGETEQSTSIELLTMAIQSPPVFDWDPAIMFGTDVLTMAQMYETLLKFNPDTNEYEPVLATGYTSSEDGLTWNFTIREGVTFHDGTPLTAEAVKFSIDRTIDMQLGPSYLWDPVDEIVAIGDYEVEFRLKYPADVAMIAAASYGGYIISPKIGNDHKASSEFLAQGNEAGTGPYRLERHVQGEEILLTKYEDYWKGWEGKHFDKILIKTVSETSSRRQMIENGDADIITGVTKEDVEIFKKNPDLVVNTAQIYQNTSAYFNTKKQPLDNKALRKAIAYAFPYEDVVNHILGTDFSSVPTDLIPKSLWGSNQTSPFYYDLDKAREYLKEAGYSDGGITLNYFYVSGNESRRKIAELFKSELAKIGITLELHSGTWDTIVSRARDSNQANQPDITAYLLWAEWPTPHAWYGASVKSEDLIIFNHSRYSNPEVDEMIQKAFEYTATDREKATELYKEIGQKVTDDCIAIYMHDDNYINVTRNDIKGNTVCTSAYPTIIFFYDCYREQ